MTPGTLELRAGDAAVGVDPAMGGRLVSWRVRDMELLGARGSLPEESGCYPMAPWPGRLRGNEVRFAGAAHRLPVTYLGFAMHGTLLRRPMAVAHRTPHRVELRGELGPAWPWPGRATVIWELGTGRLRSRLEVATDGEPFPAELGWHPWFRRRLAHGEPMRWRMEARAVLERDADGLPTGRRLDPAARPGPFDDAFEVPDGRARIDWPGALTLRVAGDAGWMVVFDELPDLVCVEPQTAPPDGLGDGAAVVRPGAPRTAEVTWTWEAA
ncbi:MAG: aldose 1-epimerase [Thermoleophilia bacterium]|nr:aldose 1-epimerase [Thermoleophilia bacterium]